MCVVVVRRSSYVYEGPSTSFPAVGTVYEVLRTRQPPRTARVRTKRPNPARSAARWTSTANQLCAESAIE